MKRVTCPKCREVIGVEPTATGFSVACPKCMAIVPIPDEVLNQQLGEMPAERGSQGRLWAFGKAASLLVGGVILYYAVRSVLSWAGVEDIRYGTSGGLVAVAVYGCCLGAGVFLINGWRSRGKR